MYIQLQKIDTTSEVFPRPSRLHPNNERKTDPSPSALLGDFSDPKEPREINEKPFKKIDIVNSYRLTFESVTPHAF